MLIYALEVIGGILLLFLGGDQFVKGSVTIATICGIPQLVIGLTVVAFGTSAPELFVSLSSILQNADDLAVSNVVGSNIFNILVVLGCSALVLPLQVEHRLVRRDVPVLLAISSAAWGMASAGRMTWQAGVALLIAIALLMLFSLLSVELASTATTRVKMAVNQRDEAQAEALAESGFHIYRLILVAAKGLDEGISGLPMLSEMGISGDSLWQQIPFLNTSMLRMIFVTGGMDEDELTDFAMAGLSEEQREESRESSGSSRSFLDFKGDFSAEVTDESMRINIKNIRVKRLSGIKTKSCWRLGNSIWNAYYSAKRFIFK